MIIETSVLAATRNQPAPGCSRQSRKDLAETAGRSMLARTMAAAEYEAARGNHLAQRVVVNIGALMPHLING